ncbi:MAG: hypothetical protein ACT4QB_01175 [Gammaproteobacteria bacterium]
MFCQGEILRALTRLGEIAWDAQRILDMAVYGGSAIVLAWGFRVSTKDVDAVVRGDPSFLRRAVRQVAEEQGWPEDWLNDGVKGFVSGNESLCLQGTYPSPERPGLRVYVPTAEYMLAMKCMAMRAEGVEEARDIEDIRHLIGITGLTTTEQVLTLVEGFYPRSLIPPRVALGVEEIVNDTGHGHKSPP